MGKPTIKYRLVKVGHPGGSRSYIRGYITDRDIYDLERVVEFALGKGYVTGKQAMAIGAFNGIIEAVKDLCQQGKWINLGNWMRIRGVLAGAIDEATRRPGPANAYRIAITPLSDLGCKVESFDWERVGVDDKCVQVTSVSSVGGAADGTLVKGKDILVEGSNLMFDAAIGDDVSGRFQLPGEHAHLDSFTVELRPKEGDATHMLIPWDQGFDRAGAGVKLHMAFRLHAGMQGAVCQRINRTLAFVDP